MRSFIPASHYLVPKMLGPFLKASLFVLIAVLFTSNLFAAPDPVKINDNEENHLFIYGELEYLKDKDFTFNDVLKGAPNEQFVKSVSFIPQLSKPNEAYWIRLRIKGDGSSNKKWLLEFFDQTIDYIEAYMPEKVAYKKIVSGDNFSFDSRRFKHKNFEFEVGGENLGEIDYYFKVKSRNPVNILITLRSFDYFLFYSLNEYLFYGLFYGMIIIITVYNFLMYLAIKQVQYIYYIFYLLSVGMYFMCLDGIAFQYLWPQHPEWNQIAVGIALFFLMAFSLLFTKAFLHTKSKYPMLNKVINIVLIVRTAVFVGILVFFREYVTYRWFDILPLSLTFISGAYAYLKGYKPARFFVIAYGLLLVGFLVRIIINLDLGFIPASIFSHYSINISFVCEMLLLSFALADKVRILKETRDRALNKIIRQHEVNIKQHEINQRLKDKVNKELEQLVTKRTKEIIEQKQIIEAKNMELQEANEMLKKQSEEINKMNALLDKDNYKLKNGIKEKVLERVSHKNIEYSDFKTIFPDELSCLRYIEKEKWSGGFSCKKCRNVKFIEGKGKFDRRCTRCGYNESPTAYTIFHGIKFPLEKAFYILHLIITERDDLTLEEVSSMLELRQNTCGKFKRKAKDIIKKNKWDKSYLQDWNNLIFYHEEETL